MRIDKYLKNARIIKRRTIAKEACDQGKVMINDKQAKAGDSVKVGDIIEINFSKPIKIQVLDLVDNPKKDDSRDLYKNID